MKKLIVLALMLVLMLSFVGCEMVNRFLGNTDDSQTNDNTSNDEQDVHVHEWEVTKRKDPNCTVAGYENQKCACGETQKVELPALGHDFQKIKETPASCEQYGSIEYKCTRCVKKEYESLKPTGEHAWAEVVEASRLIVCTKPGCTRTMIAESTNKYTEDLTFTFGDEEKAALAAKHEELAAVLAAADAYDATLHGYAEEGDLAEAYKAAEALYEEYSDLIFSAQGQYSVAMTLYYCDHKNKELEQTYNDMMNYYTELVANFYSLSQPWYDSMFREFFFYGATEEEVNAFLFDSNALANPEYTELKDRNDAIELEFNSIANPLSGDEITILYAEFVENNNRIAEILGYDNYLEYAYENVYGRDYTYQEVAAFVEYVKKYIVPAYNMVYSKWGTLTGGTLSNADIEQYYEVVDYSFFTNIKSNKLFNDYIDEMAMAFTSNPDKQISFSDELNNLMVDGNLFRGTYEGAYVTYIVDGDIPIAYFGQNGYDNATTIAHEFGHYMNEIYNRSEYDQSFDLLETHSQGQEMLFIDFVEGYVTETAYELIETYQILNTLSIIMSALQVDTFEQAVYLNFYDGPNSDVIMADGKITADEYDLLYASISEDFGIAEKYRQDTYWRYGMTITSPCYYVSYSLSAINSLGIYAKIHQESFEAAKESYLKLFTYTDVDAEMDTEEVLLYAGLLSYNDEALYSSISKFLTSNVIN